MHRVSQFGRCDKRVQMPFAAFLLGDARQSVLECVRRDAAGRSACCAAASGGAASSSAHLQHHAMLHGDAWPRSPHAPLSPHFLLERRSKERALLMRTLLHALGLLIRFPACAMHPTLAWLPHARAIRSSRASRRPSAAAPHLLAASSRHLRGRLQVLNRAPRGPEWPLDSLGWPLGRSRTGTYERVAEPRCPQGRTLSIIVPDLAPIAPPRRPRGNGRPKCLVCLLQDPAAGVLLCAFLQQQRGPERSSEASAAAGAHLACGRHSPGGMPRPTSQARRPPRASRRRCEAPGGCGPCGTAAAAADQGAAGARLRCQPRDSPTRALRSSEVRPLGRGARAERASHACPAVLARRRTEPETPPTFAGSRMSSRRSEGAAALA
jgi:hypothetical protein